MADKSMSSHSPPSCSRSSEQNWDNLSCDISDFLVDDEELIIADGSVGINNSNISQTNVVVDEKQRFWFKVKSEHDFLEDGYKWRKYGKKKVKYSSYPRSEAHHFTEDLRNYFRCSQQGCNVKKRVERYQDDNSYVITSYLGKHNHQAPTSTTSRP